MEKKSFSDIVEGEAERLINYAFQENPDIKNFYEFDSAFRKAFGTPLGSNAKITAEDMIKLFETPETQARISQNVTAKEFDDLYGDGKEVERIPEGKKKVITIVIEKPIKSKTRSGVAYNKSYKRWNNKELNFLKAKKQKKISSTKIISDYNDRFKDSPRTKSSIKTRLYRI